MHPLIAARIKRTMPSQGRIYKNAMAMITAEKTCRDGMESPLVSFAINGIIASFSYGLGQFNSFRTKLNNVNEIAGINRILLNLFL